jgi:hypothetical protein
MRFSSGIRASAPLAMRRSAGLQLAWRNAADDVHEAYLAWRDADRPQQPAAFFAYRAALDREQAAARALELQKS